jgi:hypothetical protein
MTALLLLLSLAAAPEDCLRWVEQVATETHP